MSVYTQIQVVELKDFLAEYALGELLSYQEIAEGIENSNYALTTTQGTFILTLFETFTAPTCQYFLRLLTHLRQGGFLCPAPQADKTGQCLKILAGKPAVIFQRLAGRSPLQPSLSHCAELGRHLAKLHLYLLDYPAFTPAVATVTSCYQRREKLKPYLSAVDNKLIETELAFQNSYAAFKLPQGLIHGDLFRDNVLFVGEKLTGLLDFYSANRETLLLDLAIAVNDWCVEDGQRNSRKMLALLTTYQHYRPLTETEQHAWPAMLRLAALRFWLSRLEHQLFTPTSYATVPKDPLVYRALLEKI